MARPATIGPEIFQRTNTLVAEGKTRTEAFAQIGQERGSSPGTVAANFYRVARVQRGAKRRAVGTRRPPIKTAAANQKRATRAPRSADNGKSDIWHIAQQITNLTQQLVRQVEERDKKIRALLG